MEKYDLQTALKLLEEMESKKPKPEELSKMISTVAGLLGWQTYESSWLQKGTIIIGTGDDPFPNVPPRTPPL